MLTYTFWDYNITYRVAIGIWFVHHSFEYCPCSNSQSPYNCCFGAWIEGRCDSGVGDAIKTHLCEVGLTNTVDHWNIIYFIASTPCRFCIMPSNFLGPLGSQSMLYIEIMVSAISGDDKLRFKWSLPKQALCRQLCNDSKSRPSYEVSCKDMHLICLWVIHLNIISLNWFAIENRVQNTFPIWCRQ